MRITKFLAHQFTHTFDTRYPNRDNWFSQTVLGAVTGLVTHYTVEWVFDRFFPLDTYEFTTPSSPETTEMTDEKFWTEEVDYWATQVRTLALDLEAAQGELGHARRRLTEIVMDTEPVSYDDPTEFYPPIMPDVDRGERLAKWERETEWAREAHENAVAARESRSVPDVIDVQARREERAGFAPGEVAAAFRTAPDND